MGSRWGGGGGGSGVFGAGGGGSFLRGKYDVVNPSLEVSDPTPDIHALFVSFNELFFEGRLSSVLVQWSPRMTLCAGVCRFRGRSGGCSIHLSKPLLSLRSRKDLVETLLHEMIHAYLFLWDREREDHGPKFKAKMNEINALTGANITVYHSFHDEVDHHKTHWWKCNGPCVSRPPYYGIVKRSMNRAPGKNDFWWAEHARTCGGSYTKIKEPAPRTYSKKGTKGGNKNSNSNNIKAGVGGAGAGAGAMMNGKQRDIASYFNSEAGHMLGGGGGGGGSSSQGGRGYALNANNGLPLAKPSCSATSMSSSSFSMDTSTSNNLMETSKNKERSSIFGTGGQQGYRLGGTSPGSSLLLSSFNNSIRQPSATSTSTSTTTPTTLPVGRGNHPLLALWESGKKTSYTEEPARDPRPVSTTYQDEFDCDDDDVVFLDQTMCHFCGEVVKDDMDSHIDICCPLEGPASFVNNSSSNNVSTNNGFGGGGHKPQTFFMPTATTGVFNGKRKVDDEGEVGRKKFKTEEMVLECPICGSGFDSHAAVDVHIDQCTTNSAMFS